MQDQALDVEVTISTKAGRETARGEAAAVIVLKRDGDDVTAQVACIGRGELRGVLAFALEKTAKDLKRDAAVRRALLAQVLGEFDEAFAASDDTAFMN